MNITVGWLSNVKIQSKLQLREGVYQPNEVSIVGKVYDQYSAALTKLNEHVLANQNTEPSN